MRKTKFGEDIATVGDAHYSPHFVRLLIYDPSRLLAEVNPHTPELLHSLGHFLGDVDKALDGFTHPASRRELKWDLQGALWIKDCPRIRRDTERDQPEMSFILAEANQSRLHGL